MSKLIVKTSLGFAFLMMILSLALFGSAGSLRFCQAWVYLSVFAGCTMLITAYLIKYDRKLLASRVKAGPIAEKRKSQQIIQSLASFFFILLFIVSGLDFRFHWSAVPSVLSFIADVFVALGFLIVFLVFKENSYTSAIIEVSEKQKVITSGPYRVVRHPMYSGGVLLIIFTPLALGSWMALPFALALTLVIVVRLLDEERFLLETLSDYKEYLQDVHYRLVPFIW